MRRRVCHRGLKFVFFFFSSRRRHTRCSRDWSSDVCSSDLMIRHTRCSRDWSSDVCSSDLAAAVVRIAYDALPAVVDAEAAMTAESPLVHEGASNVVGQVSKVIGDVDRAFAEAAVVVEDHPAHGRVSSMAIETRSLCAQFDGATHSMTVWAPHHGPYNLRAAVAARLGLPAESVRVIAPDTGGGFGPKEGVYPEDGLVPIMARRLGRPVKWIQTRTEFISSTHHAREQSPPP